MAFPVLAISDRRSLRDETLADWLRRMVAFAIPAVQLREKDLGERELYDLAGIARRILPEETPAPHQLQGRCGHRRQRGRRPPSCCWRGVEPARFSEVAAAGASGVAGIRLFQRVSSVLPEILRLARDSFPIREPRSQVVTAQTTAPTTEPN